MTIKGYLQMSIRLIRLYWREIF